MSVSVSFPHEEPNPINEENTMIHFTLDPEHLPPTDWRRFDAMTEQARHAAALADRDSQPVTAEQLASARRVPDVHTLRYKLNLTQEQFVL